VGAWWWRRARAVASAKKAFELEAGQVGDAFDPESLRRREWNYVLIAESSALLSRWTEGSVSDALCVASEALRGAFWLWLEDDDRAMTLTRTVLEQTARARTWRIKPSNAVRVEGKGSRAGTRDWFEEAGWRRLSILNKSLSEFSHVNANSRWSGAREALADFQKPLLREMPASPLQTGRGSALNTAAYLLGLEVRLWAESIAPEIARAIADYLPFGNEDAEESDVETWLNHAWTLRGRDFGVSDFQTSSDDEAIESE
jgi:hypothetical protein